MSWRSGSRVWSNYRLRKNRRDSSSFPWGSLPTSGSIFPRRGTQLLWSSRRWDCSRTKAIFRHMFAVSIEITLWMRVRIRSRGNRSYKIHSRSTMRKRVGVGESRRWAKAVISTNIMRYMRRRSQSRSFRILFLNNPKRGWDLWKRESSLNILLEKSSWILPLRCSNTVGPFKNNKENPCGIGPRSSHPLSNKNTANTSRIVSKNHVASQVRTSVLFWRVRRRRGAVSGIILPESTCLTV